MNERLDYITLTIGRAGHLGAEELRQAIEITKCIVDRISPLTAIDIAIDGYNDDPREIWDIPEARRFLLAYADGIGLSDSFLPTTLSLIGLCKAAEEGHEITVIDGDIDIIKQLREHQARARRQMQ